MTNPLSDYVRTYAFQPAASGDTTSAEWLTNPTVGGAIPLPAGTHTVEVSTTALVGADVRCNIYSGATSIGTAIPTVSVTQDTQRIGVFSITCTTAGEKNLRIWGQKLNANARQYGRVGVRIIIGPPA